MVRYQNLLVIVSPPSGHLGNIESSSRAHILLPYFCCIYVVMVLGNRMADESKEALFKLSNFYIISISRIGDKENTERSLIYS